MIKCKNSCPLGKFEGCCRCCPDWDTCEEVCTTPPEKCDDAVFDEESAVTVFQQKQVAALKQIALICNQKKALEAQEKTLKDQLKQAMEQYGIKKFESPVLNVTYVASTTTSKLDSAAVKKKYPAVAEECSKVSTTSSYIKVEVKEGGQA